MSSKKFSEFQTKKTLPLPKEIENYVKLAGKSERKKTGKNRGSFQLSAYDNVYL